MLCIPFDVQKTSLRLLSHNSDLNQGKKVCENIYYLYMIKLDGKLDFFPDNTKYWNHSLAGCLFNRILLNYIFKLH